MTGLLYRKAARSIAALAMVGALLLGLGPSAAGAQDDAATDQRVVRLVGTYEVRPERGERGERRGRGERSRGGETEQTGLSA